MMHYVMRCTVMFSGLEFFSGKIYFQYFIEHSDLKCSVCVCAYMHTRAMCVHVCVFVLTSPN